MVVKTEQIEQNNYDLYNNPELKTSVKTELNKNESSYSQENLYQNDKIDNND